MVQPLVFLGGQESIVQLGFACTRVFCESAVSASQAFPQHSGGSGHQALRVLQTQLHGYCPGELGEDQPPALLPLLSCVPESVMSGKGSWEPAEGHWQQQNRMGSQGPGLICSAQSRDSLQLDGRAHSTSIAVHQAVCSKTLALSWFRNTTMVTATLYHTSCLSCAPQTGQSQQRCVGSQLGDTRSGDTLQLQPGLPCSLLLPFPF